jgi:hypothetical protein
MGDRGGLSSIFIEDRKLMLIAAHPLLQSGFAKADEFVERGDRVEAATDAEAIAPGGNGAKGQVRSKTEFSNIQIQIHSSLNAMLKTLSHSSDRRIGMLNH